MSDGESEGERRLRLFCALDLPEATVARIAAWQREQGREGLRAVSPEALHLTLAFLGQRPESEVEAIAAQLAALEPRAVEGRLLTEPVPVPRRRPRLLALEVAGEAIGEVQSALERRLVEAGLHEPAERPFWPHLTVFRLPGGPKQRGGGGSKRAPVPRLAPLPDRDGHAFGFVRVALYRSDLRPEGASYSRLAANELPQPGGRQKR